MLFEDTYKTIKNISEGSFRDKGSKFFAKAYPVKTEQEVKLILSALKKEYHDAHHHCYSYILGFDKSVYRINDDGEISGSAGKQIHGQLLAQGLTNILVVVIRYFGGIKLGIPGLINAYRTATIDAIANNHIIECIVRDIYEISFPYEKMNDVLSIMKDERLEQLNSVFEMDCKIEFSVRKSIVEKVYSKFLKLSNVKIRYLYTD